MSVSASGVGQRLTIQDEILALGKKNQSNQGEVAQTAKKAKDDDAVVAQATKPEGSEESQGAIKGRGYGIGRGQGRGPRRRIQDEILNPNPQSAPPVTAEGSGVEAAQEASEVNEAETEQLSLAARYVDQFIKTAGKTMSIEERDQLIQDVQSFYSEPHRAGRLEQIVFN